MKILITYVAAGAGHFKAAQAIYNYFKETNHYLDIELVDALGYCNSFFRNNYKNCYGFMINYTPWLWGFVFYLTSFGPLYPLTNLVHSFMNRLNASRLRKFLINADADYIISTHFLPSQIAASLVRNKRIKSKVITVITDFGVHPFWIHFGTDIYIASCDATRRLLISKGIREDRVKDLGIPIDSKFLKIQEKELLYSKFNIQKNKFTALVVTGSFGIGPIEKIVESLHKDVQLLVVCAKNKGLFHRLKRKNYPNVRVFGFVDNIEELMAVSDVVITKPGGLTIAELLARQLFPIFIYPIPGQETTNARVLEACGVGQSARNIEDIKGWVLAYKNYPDRIMKAKENMMRIRRPQAAEGIYNVVCQSSAGDTR